MQPGNARPVNIHSATYFVLYYRLYFPDLGSPISPFRPPGDLINISNRSNTSSTPDTDVDIGILRTPISMIARRRKPQATSAELLLAGNQPAIFCKLAVSRFDLLKQHRQNLHKLSYFHLTTNENPSSNSGEGKTRKHEKSSSHEHLWLTASAFIESTSALTQASSSKRESTSTVFGATVGSVLDLGKRA